MDRAQRLIHAVITARYAPLGQTPKEIVRLSNIRVPLLNAAALADAIAPRPMTAPIMNLVSSADRG